MRFDPKTPLHRRVHWRRSRVAGHFGELIQGLYHGEVALLTLPCPIMGASVAWQPAAGGIAVHQPSRVLSRSQIRGAFEWAQGRPAFGRLVIRTGMPAGAGAGASTAALLALGRVLGLPQDAEAAFCLSLEGASDPLMRDDPGDVLWLSREAQVARALPPLPAMEVLGSYHGPPQRTRAEDRHFAPVEDLVEAWATGDGSARLLAELATRSAERNAALRGVELGAVRDLAARHGALGFSISHTGPARALLFAPGTAPRSRIDPSDRIRFKVGPR